MKYIKFPLALLIITAVTMFSTSHSQATDGPVEGAAFKLIMFEELGCEYCDLWNEQIGVTYPNTPEGRFAPLTRVFKGDRSVSHIKRVIYTPTFVVMQGNKEIGRILGYPGEEFFWAFLGEILEKAGFKPAS